MMFSFLFMGDGCRFQPFIFQGVVGISFLAARRLTYVNFIYEVQCRSGNVSNFGMKSDVESHRLSIDWDILKNWDAPGHPSNLMLIPVRCLDHCLF